MKISEPASRCDRHIMTWDNTFNFSCRPGIDCFNSCCRDVTIFLNPLDVVRLRKALDIPSTAFLHKFTDIVISPASGLPAVVLKMGADEQKKCPFVTEKGCDVYEDRPYSCRLYPLDTEQGVEYSFIVQPDKCHGLNETDEWSIERWRKEQGLYDYDDLDHNLKDVMCADQVWEQKIQDSRMQDMFMMAIYDVDRFREFVFESSFLTKFHVDDDILEKIREDDVSLLYFAGQWLRFAFFGKKGFLKIDREYLDQKKKIVLGGKR